jgi:hypothetical protein
MRDLTECSPMTTTIQTVADVLRQIERKEPDALLSDGADIWTAENLRRALEHEEAPELDRECVWSEVGVILLSDDGYRMTPPWLSYVVDDRFTSGGSVPGRPKL